MSVDRTIAELSNTLAQLSTLVEQVNAQLGGITSRINITLDNFDTSVAGIASDAGAMTGQVGDTISQIPNSWVFYLLFITLIIVLILLSILIVINLATKLHAIYRLIRGDSTRKWGVIFYSLFYWHFCHEKKLSHSEGFESKTTNKKNLFEENAKAYILHFEKLLEPKTSFLLQNQKKNFFQAFWTYLKFNSLTT